MMRTPALALVVLLAACAVPPPPAQPPQDEVLATVEAPPPTTLAGSWDVSLLDGDALGETLIFSADDGAIWWEPVCAGAMRSYRIEGNRIALSGSSNEGLPRDGGGGIAVCTVGIPPQLTAYMHALAGVDTIQSAPAGAVRLHGHGLVLLLTPRHDEARAQTAYPATIVGEWRVAGLDGQPLDIPLGLTVSIGSGRIDYATVCGGYAWDYSYSQGGLTLREVRKPDAACLASATAPREVFTVADRIGEALGAARIAQNGMELSGGEGSVTLFSQ